MCNGIKHIELFLELTLLIGKIVSSFIFWYEVHAKETLVFCSSYASYLSDLQLTLAQVL